MSTQDLQVYGYRWIVLLLFFLVNVISNILWTTYAPVTTHAMEFYGVDEFLVIFISLVFLIVYIPITFLATWLIDKYEFKIGASIGALLMGVFGFLRFIAGNNYILALIFSIGIAIAQPFLLNTITKLSANWFPETERTTATGISLIATGLGVALGMIMTPILVINLNFGSMLLIYGILALISSIVFVILVKNKPPTPPSSNSAIDKIYMLKGFKLLFSNRNFVILTVIFTLGMGTFNMITTYIELIVIPRGFDSIFAGILGMALLSGGIAGTIIMSLLSDKLKHRKSIMILSMIIATVSLLVFSFSYNALLLIISIACFGFGLMGSGPVTLEYAVDVTKPVPEASSNGMLMMGGAIGGIIFIVGLENVKFSGDYFPALIIQTVLLALCVVLTFFLEEFKVKEN
ncbi:MAG: MFS transporter [Promethearchaeota archaeon]